MVLEICEQGSTAEWHGGQVLVGFVASGGWLGSCAQVVALLVFGDGDIGGGVMVVRATVPLGIGLEWVWLDQLRILLFEIWFRA